MNQVRTNIGLDKDRRLDDVMHIAYVPNNQRALEITYREREKPLEVIYEAETPTDCAEICAKIQFYINSHSRISEEGPSDSKTSPQR